MEFAGLAVGIASPGIQVFLGLLSYYKGWRGFEGNATDARTSITDLRETFGLLEAPFAASLNLKRSSGNCKGSIMPSGLRRKAYTESQRAWYPLYPKTLTKLRGIMGEL
jgi:hypothetical protein